MLGDVRVLTLTVSVDSAPALMPVGLKVATTPLGAAATPSCAVAGVMGTVDRNVNVNEPGPWICCEGGSTEMRNASRPAMTQALNAFDHSRCTTMRLPVSVSSASV